MNDTRTYVRRSHNMIKYDALRSEIRAIYGRKVDSKMSWVFLDPTIPV